MSFASFASAAVPYATAGADYFSAKSLQDDAQSFKKNEWRSKHQWEVSDLKAAGLNPILSAHSGGSPGSTGMSSASPGTTFNSARRIKTEMSLNAAREKTQVDLGNLYDEQRWKTHAELVLLQQQIPRAYLDASFWGSSAGKLKYYSDQAFDSGQNIKNLINPFNFGKRASSSNTYNQYYNFKGLRR